MNCISIYIIAYNMQETMNYNVKSLVQFERVAEEFASNSQKSMKFPHSWGNTPEMAKSRYFFSVFN